MRPFHLADEKPPQVSWHLIGRVAAKAAKTQGRVVFHQFQPIVPQAVSIRAAGVIDLGQITPDHLTVPLLGAGVERLAIRPALVPVRMLFH